MSVLAEYEEYFKSEWDKVTKVLKDSGYDLSKITLKRVFYTRDGFKISETQ